MNYTPFVGWGFYGAASDLQRASYFVSWGLLQVCPFEAEVVSVQYFEGKLIIGIRKNPRVFILGSTSEWSCADILYPDGARLDYFNVTLYRHNGTHLHVNTSNLTLYFP